MYAPGRRPVNGPLLYWHEAIHRPGAAQMQYLRALIESRPYLSRVPDQSIVVNALTGADYIAATRGDGYVFVYSAQGRPFTVNLGKIPGALLQAWWYNPRTGTATEAGTFENRGTKDFTPPSQGFGSDWVLVLDNAARLFPPPGQPANPARAQTDIQDISYPSKLNGRDIPIKIYLPPGYEKGSRRYPVVYNLHGAGGGSPERQWERTWETIRGAMESGQAPPMIYVFVNGLGDTFFVDYADGSLRIESSIVQELIPFIDTHYRTIPTRENRAVDGFSMGGFGCLMLAFKHAELFGSVVSYGAALIPFQPGSARFASREHFDRYDPFALVEKNKDRIRRSVRVRMVCGGEDKLLPNNVRMKDLLNRLKIPVSWVVVPGVAHDTRGLYRRVGLESFKFIAAGFSAEAR
jgi:enterochelin esterase-like enzyme